MRNLTSGRTLSLGARSVLCERQSSRGTGVIEGGAWGEVDPHAAERGVGVAVNALGIGAVERQPGEELRCHAPALACIVAAAAGARTSGLRSAKFDEQFAVLPHTPEPAVVTHRTGLELIMDHEGTGVDIANRIDEAHD